MRRSACILLLVVVIVGCSSIADVTPRTRLGDMIATYTVCVETATRLMDAGIVSLKAAESIMDVQRRAGAALDAAKAQSDLGATIDFTSLEATIETLKALVLIASQGVTSGR